MTFEEFAREYRDKMCFERAHVSAVCGRMKGHDGEHYWVNLEQDMFLKFDDLITNVDRADSCCYEVVDLLTKHGYVGD